jgi:hypothetical protein
MIHRKYKPYVFQKSQYHEKLKRLFYTTTRGEKYATSYSGRKKKENELFKH